MNISKKRVAAVVVSILVVSVIGFLVVDPMYFGIGVVGECGFCFISGVNDSNSNTSYSLVFHGVNFTFLYTTYPYQATDLPFIAHFRISFPDDVIENITLDVGGYVVVDLTAPLRVAASLHLNPRAAVATANSFRLVGKWIFLVSL
ncbi:MAG: hypothetical protein ACFE8Z_03000 [Candidatus Hermodarchaeota archaeon]